MKLIRFGAFEMEKPGVQLADGRRVDVSGWVKDYNEDFFANDGLILLENYLDKNESTLPLVPPSERLGCCIARPSKIVCIGLNYAKHAKESGMAVPSEPVIFFKSTTALCGPNDDVIIPKGSTKTDWEVELAFIIGKRASHVSQKNAMDYVAGYALHNDYSERAFQLEQGGQWVKGKSYDSFAPLGPYLVTTDEIPNPHNLHLWLKVNGKMLQNSNTSDFIFDIPTVISYLTQYMTLLPSDVISTGTPSGVGLGFNPPRYLNPGDVVELGIEGLGISRQKAIAYSDK